MMLRTLSVHTIRRNITPYVGSAVALLLGTTLIALTVEVIAAVSSYQSRLGPGDSDVRLQLDDLSSMLGVMSSFSGFMAIFVVASTFSFVVSSRRRELGLLRLIGTTPKQVRRMILGESFIVAIVAAVAGCIVAHAIAPVAVRLLHDRGLAPVLLEPPSIWLSLAIALPIGVLVALLGARAAARRAARISPVDAMRESAVERRRLGFWRITMGLLLGAGAVAMLVLLGNISGELSLALGIFAPEMLVVAIVCFGPLLFPVLTRLVAWPLLRSGDITIRMARDNLVASAKRTASLAAPILAISGIAGSLILTLSTAADWDNAINKQALKAPVVVQADGPDHQAAEILASSAVVRTADAGATTPITVHGPDQEREKEDAESIDVADAVAARSLHARSGSLDDLQGKAVALSRTYVSDNGGHVGDRLTIEVGDGDPIKVRVAAIVDDAPSLHGDVLLPWGIDGSDPVPDRWFVIPNDGTGDPVTTLNDELAGTTARAEAAKAWIQGTDDDMRKGNALSLWMLLGPSGIYAALAIANTLLMGSLQRHGEFVATRLIGATERQVRRIVLWESALVTATSLILGGAITATVGILIRGALSEDLTSMPLHVPWAGLTAIGGTCLAVATLAALAPTTYMLRRVHPSQATQ